MGLADPKDFAARLAPLRKTNWVTYAKPPFGDPGAALAYLSYASIASRSRTNAS